MSIISGGIVEVRDEFGPDGLRIAIELEHEHNQRQISPTCKSTTTNMVAIDSSQLVTVPILSSYTEVILARSRFDKRLHIIVKV